MKVIRSSHVGLCFGVQRARDMAERILGSEAGAAAVLGSLMHNPQEMARLKALGLKQVTTVAQCVGFITLVRAHGISKQQLEEASRLGVTLEDATCPHVLTPRKKLERMGMAGRTVILLGDENHAEVRAQVSYATGPVFVAMSESALPDLPRDTPIGLIAQTTLTEERFLHMAARVAKSFDDVKIYDTICTDTQQRQKAAMELAGKVDAMVVVGGRNSANTCRLVEICESTHTHTVHIEEPHELFPKDLRGVEVVGLTSGASTPEWLLEAVHHRLEEF